MAKWKAITIDTVITILLIGLIYMSWSYGLQIFFAFSGMFAIYGFGQFVYVLYTWLLEPSKDAKHRSIDPPIKVPPIRETWIDPFKKVKEQKDADS